MALLDMTAAFDTTDHNILLERFDKTFVVRQSALGCFKAYLKTEPKSLSCDISGSSYSKCFVGWQESVLGPMFLPQGR